MFRYVLQLCCLKSDLKSEWDFSRRKTFRKGKVNVSGQVRNENLFAQVILDKRLETNSPK